MTDPERLFHGDSSELTKTMLGAAREEMPSDRLMERTLLAIGAGAVVLGASAAAGGASISAAGTSSLSAIAAKWFGIGAVGGLVTMGAATAVQHAVSRPAEVKQVTTFVPAAPRAVAAAGKPRRGSVAVPEVAEPDKPAPKLAIPAPTVEPVEKDPGEPSIAAELAAIDGARSALASGDTARALSLVDAYERRSGTKRLLPEALVIRMDAQSRSGNGAGARATAERLLAMSPNGPHAARARQILGR